MFKIRDPANEASVPAAPNFKVANTHCLGECSLSMLLYEAFASVRMNRMCSLCWSILCCGKRGMEDRARLRSPAVPGTPNELLYEQ